MNIVLLYYHPTLMTCWRKTSKSVAKTASKILKSKSSSPAAKKVAGSALSQRAPTAKKAGVAPKPPRKR